MRAVIVGDGRYTLSECPRPAPAPEEVIIKVAYAGVNRADLLQKQGRYPLPERSPAIPGLEVSGEISGWGARVTEWKAGDKVCALLREGAFGDYARAPAALVLPLPSSLTLQQGAALPEAAFTAWISLVWQARLQAGETALIHGGAGGVGHIAIQIARALGARVFATAGTEEKCTLCEKAGAEKAICYPREDYVSAVKHKTAGRGVDVILDMVGGDYFERNLESLAEDGRLCIIAFLKGAKREVNLAPILLKRLWVMGSMLRPRPLEEKARLAAELRQRLWPAIAGGAVKPVIDRVFSLEEAEKALERMDQGLNSGKILLSI